MEKGRIGGGLAVITASAFALLWETLRWGWGKLLTFMTDGSVSWSSFPWRDVLGVLGLIIGFSILFWPKIQRTFRRKPNPVLLLAHEIDANFEAFEAMLPTLMVLAPGKYALMRDRQVVAAHEGPGEALSEGADRFPDGRFSIQHVTDQPVCLGWYSYVVPLV